MNSHLNNTNDNPDQVFQETESFRPVFFDSSSKRNSSSSSQEPPKRARLDASVMAPAANDHHHHHHNHHHSHHNHNHHQNPSTNNTPIKPSPHSSHNSRPLHHRHLLLHHHLFRKGHDDSYNNHSESPVSSSVSSSPQPPPPTDSPAPQKKQKSRLFPHANAHGPPPPQSSSSAKSPKAFRKFRSRSLPIINYTSRVTPHTHIMNYNLPHIRFPPPNVNPAATTTTTNNINTSAVNGKSSNVAAAVASNAVAPPTNQAHHANVLSHSLASQSVPSLPPINLQSLKEIDLHEILKNPQLRHDILFDPQLQFRPNLDGERGRRKKSIIEKYWSEVEAECKQFFLPASTANHTVKLQRLPVLFTTLRDILLSLLPIKDRAPVLEIMDIDLLVQQLSHGSFDFVSMSNWLGEVFKSHCAPMRDQWVSDMMAKFHVAYTDNSVEKLVHGLRTIFFILEAMKLDMANHQIRMLRPALIETAVDFEKDYFDQLISHGKIDISDSLKWFYRNFHKKAPSAAKPDPECLKTVILSSIVDLLSCCSMATEFPSTLAFDHTRLVLLRADIRQLVCVQLCIVLFKQLVNNYAPAAAYKTAACKSENITKVQEEILAIVTDDNGNVKWTRNVQAISLQLVKKVMTNPTTGKLVSGNPPQAMIDFSYNWLIKQTQPNSDVYALMEAKIFKDLLNEINGTLSADNAINVNSLANEFKLGSTKMKKTDSEMSNIATRISTLVKFHWSVFGDYYTNFVKEDSL